MTVESWLAFCAIALLATATPGPAVLLVSTNCLIVGFKKSLLTVVGNITGLMLMSSCSVLGLSAIVLHSAIAFTVIKVLGALYLVYIGLNLWRKGIAPLEANPPGKVDKSSFNLFIQGVLVALTNPKAIIFTTALFPQFIVVSESLLPQFILLVGTFMTLSFICLAGYSLLAHGARKRAVKVTSGKFMGRVFGSTFIGAGCLLATAPR